MFFHDNPKQFAFFALTVLGILASAGCQRNNGRQSLSGIVTLDGRPAADAVIHFQPPPGQTGNSSGAATDADGRFQIAAVQGLLPGNYAVSIQKWEGTGRKVIDPETRKPVEITAPIPFKEDGKLEAKITPEGPNQFEFRLTRAK
jgi:hypothetical protein